MTSIITQKSTRFSCSDCMDHCLFVFIYPPFPLHESTIQSDIFCSFQSAFLPVFHPWPPILCAAERHISAKYPCWSDVYYCCSSCGPRPWLLFKNLRIIMWMLLCWCGWMSWKIIRFQASAVGSLYLVLWHSLLVCLLVCLPQWTHTRSIVPPINPMLSSLLSLTPLMQSLDKTDPTCNPFLSTKNPVRGNRCCQNTSVVSVRGWGSVGARSDLAAKGKTNRWNSAYAFVWYVGPLVYFIALSRGSDRESDSFRVTLSTLIWILRNSMPRLLPRGRLSNACWFESLKIKYKIKFKLFPMLVWAPSALCSLSIVLGPHRNSEEQFRWVLAGSPAQTTRNQ